MPALDDPVHFPALPKAGLAARPALAALRSGTPKLPRSGPGRGVKMSLGEFLTTGEPLRPYDGRKETVEPEKNPEERRVLGHEPTGAATQGDRRRIQGILKGLKDARRARKAQIADLLHNPAKPDPAGEDRVEEERKGEEDRRPTPEKVFDERLEDYTSKLHRTRITPAKMRGALTARGYQMYHDPNTLQTHILRGDRHVYTLHAGPSAFRRYETHHLPLSHPGPVPGHAGRDLFTKAGSPGKQYVADDNGVPTRRYAYAVKSGTQVDRLHRQGEITGRHQALRGLPADQATEGERAELGMAANRPLTDDEVVYMHQEFGSSDRQRGVSLASTAKPLLSNAGDGFANMEVTLPGGRKILTPDGRAQKLKVDLARVPPRERDEAPTLVNLHHRIPGLPRGVTAPPLYHAETGLEKYSAKRNQGHIDWSAGKNRELYLRTLKQDMVAGTPPVADRERAVGTATRSKQFKAAAVEKAKADRARSKQEQKQREKAERGAKKRLEAMEKPKEKQGAAASSLSGWGDDED